MADLDRHPQGLGQRPALVLVDVINGFTDPNCPLGSDADAVVSACERLLQAFREAGLPVFFTTVVYRNADQARVFRDRLPALDVLEPGSRWVEVDPRVAPSGDEIIVEKQWASGFFKTRLHEHLTAAGADSLVVVGLTTSGCVRATAVGDRNARAHEANLFDLDAKYADVVPVETVLQHLKTSIIHPTQQAEEQP